MKRNLPGYLLVAVMIVFIMSCSKKITVTVPDEKTEKIYQELKKELSEINKPTESKPIAKEIPETKNIGEEIEEIAKLNEFSYDKEEKRYLCDTYVVGSWWIDKECLWNIAKKIEIYNDAWQWRKIYKANKDKITDPNLIFKNQVLDIPR